MSSRFEEFDPDNCSQEQLDYLADHIENYLIVFKKGMIIPEEIMKEYGKSITDAIKITENLIKKLRKGDAPLDLDNAYD